MRYENKFATFFRGVGLIIGVALVACGGFLTFLPAPQLLPSFATLFIAPGKNIKYNDNLLIAPDFIPESKLAAYFKYDLYSSQHVKFTSYYCPNRHIVSHREGYCEKCSPEATLKRYEEGNHNPSWLRRKNKSIKILSEDGETVIIQRVE